VIENWFLFLSQLTRVNGNDPQFKNYCKNFSGNHKNLMLFVMVIYRYSDNC